MKKIAKVVLYFIYKIKSFFDDWYGRDRNELILSELNPQITSFIETHSNRTTIIEKVTTKELRLFQYQHFHCKEYILRAAIAICNQEGKYQEVYSVAAPGHHAEIFPFMNSKDPFWNPSYSREKQQGFLTNTNRFVDREEGLKIAQAAKQVLLKHGNDTDLFSEDMWNLTEQNERFRKLYVGDFRAKVSSLLSSFIMWLKHTTKVNDV